MTGHDHSTEQRATPAERPPSHGGAPGPDPAAGHGDGPAHGHGHGHGHTPDVDFGELVEHLRAGAAMHAEVGDRGRVHALDVTPVLLDVVREHAREHGVGDRVRVAAAGIEDLPDALPEPVDVVWAGAVVHHVGDQLDALRRLVACVRPGGHVVIAEGGVAPRSLPWDVGVGAPGLELRLLAAHDRWFGAMRASLPGSTRAPLAWPALLAEAGLVEVTERAYLTHRPAPLPDAARLHVVGALTARVERAGELLDADDRAAWARLLDESDDAWLGRRADLSLLGVDTTHTGRRPG